MISLYLLLGLFSVIYVFIGWFTLNAWSHIYPALYLYAGLQNWVNRHPNGARVAGLLVLLGWPILVLNAAWDELPDVRLDPQVPDQGALDDELWEAEMERRRLAAGEREAEGRDE